MKTQLYRERLLYIVLIAGIILAADQLSKWAVLEYFQVKGSQVTPLTSFLNLVLVFNPGISFGLLGDHSLLGPYAFTVFALIVTVVLIMWAYKTPEFLQCLYFSFVIGGALGNVIDRLRFDAVVDFIDVHGFGYHWPAFNLADSAITLGVLALILNNLFKKPESGK
jgi:signal peptidase II